MKKTDRSIEVADLDAVAHFGEDLVIFIYCEEDNIPATLSVQADFDTLQFGPVQPMALYLELNSYQPIQDGDTQISYRKRIQEEMDPVAVAAMLSDFTKKQLLNPWNEGYDYSQGWQPGG
jgi:hypothetical protein